MIPYESPRYFIPLIVAIIPLIIAHLKGKKWMGYQAVFTFAFLWLTFGGPNIRSGIALLCYGVWQVLIVKGYEYYRITLKKNTTHIFIISILLSLVPLFCVKLTPFIIHKPSLFGFLGISYLTFKSINVIMEIRDGALKEVKLLHFIYFMYFFPTISSGPIDRYRRFANDMDESFANKDYINMLGKGFTCIFIGLFYKFIVGYLIDIYALHPFAIEATKYPVIFNLLKVMYSYGLYLFFDFAGYSMFAVGVSYIMGYEIPKNFNLPFISKNIKDFWNRWHMSLSFWFRDFVYMRLVYFIVKKRVIKNRNVISNISYFGLFLLMGAWHGLTWYYLAYGAYHAVLMCVTDAWIRWKKKHKGLVPTGKAIDVINIVLTFHAVMFSFLIFSGIFDFIIKYPVTKILPSW
ncbi:MAG: D-alanyl-lipoteichoic acid biosynthesis protein DltB [Lachnospiraceae bacterium]|jgi:membrane protein involved in D-alanine export|nr:D-alanyl-lipoteichoic acid biosynthesis protein DltB [Lachnospiraceae bacterium]